jgi:hypothetical protein
LTFRRFGCSATDIRLTSTDAGQPVGAAPVCIEDVEQAKHVELDRITRERERETLHQAEFHRI